MKYVIGVVIALAILFGIQLFINQNNNQGSSLVAQNATTSVADTTNNTNMDTNTLKVEDIKVGTGAEAVAGKKVTVDYTGTFTDGKVFDSSIPRGQPFQFTLGAGMVIQGWDQGVAGMKVGGERKLTVPPSLGYGPNDYGPIPGNSTLIFDVKLLKVE